MDKDAYEDLDEEDGKMEIYGHNPYCVVKYKEGNEKVIEDLCFAWVKHTFTKVETLTYKCKDLVSTALNTDIYTKAFIEEYKKSQFANHYKDIIDIKYDNTLRPESYFQTVDITINVGALNNYTEFLTLCNIFRIIQECPDQVLAILRLQREYPDHGFLTNFYLSQGLYDPDFPKGFFKEAIPGIHPYYRRLEGHGISDPYCQIPCDKLDEDYFVKIIKSQVEYTGNCHRSILDAILKRSVKNSFDLAGQEYYLPITKENVEKVQKCL